MPKLYLIIAIAPHYSHPARQLRELGAEVDAIGEALRPAVEQGVCEPVVLHNATAAKIREAFARAEGPVVGFHFGGHAGGYELMLSEAEKIPGEGLAAFLGEQPQLRFVFLNGCATADQVEGLHQAGVPVVIATAMDIFDEVARDVAASFYTQLGQGKSLESSFRYYESIQDLRGGARRGLKLREGEGDSLQVYPWAIYYRPGAQAAMAEWSLGAAAEDPLFGLPAPATEGALPQRPYLPLQRYEAKHAALFFGRGNDIRRLYEMVTDPAMPPVILLYGQSGVGKSSLLAAGLLPRLGAWGAAHYERRTKAGLPADWQRIRALTPSPRLLILDQVEAAYTQPGAAGGEQEVQQLASMLRAFFEDREATAGRKVILAYRKEYHPEVSAALESAMAPFTEVFLRPLDRTGVEEVVAGVAASPDLQRRYQLSVAEKLPAVIAEDVLQDQQSAVAPVLQILLARMWEAAKARHPDQPQFSLDLYRRLRREGILLSDFIERELRAVRDWRPAYSESGLVLDLLYFFTTPEGAAAGHPQEAVPARYDDRRDAINELCGYLIDRYLLQVEGGEEAPQLRLAHDTLAPVIRRRYQSSTLPGPVADRIIENGRPDGDLLDPETYLNAEQVRQVEKGRYGMRRWTTREENWIAASRRHWARQRRQRRLFLGALVGAGLITLVTLFLLYRSTVRANQRNKASLIELRARALESADPTAALEQYRASLAAFYSPAVEARLYRLYRENNFYRLLHRDTVLPFNAAAITPDGKRLVLAQSDAGLSVKTTLWDRKDAALVLRSELPGASLTLERVAITNDGRIIAGGGLNHKLYLWNDKGTLLSVDSGLVIRQLALHPAGRSVALCTNDRVLEKDLNKDAWDTLPLPGDLRALQYAPDGQLIGLQKDSLFWRLGAENNPATLPFPVTAMAAGAGAGELVLVEKEAGRLYRYDWRTGDWEGLPVSNPLEVPQLLGSGPHGKSLLLGEPGGRLYLRYQDVTTGEELLIGHRDAVLAAQALPDGGVISVGRDRTVRHWPLRRRRAVDTLPTIPTLAPLSAIAVGKDLVAAGAADRRAYVWERSSGTLIAAYEEHTARLTQVLLDPQHNWAVSSDRSGAVHRWAVRTASREQLLAPGEGIPVEVLALHPDGRHLAAADRIVRYLSVGEGLQDTLALPEETIVTAMAFSADGRYLAAAATDSTVRVWEPGTGDSAPQVYRHPEALVAGLVFLPESGRLVTALAGGRFFVWDEKGAVQQTFDLEEEVFDLVAHPARDELAVLTGPAVYFVDGQGRQYANYAPRLARGGEAGIADLAFSPDGAFVFLALQNGQVLQIATPRPPEW